MTERIRRQFEDPHLPRDWRPATCRNALEDSNRQQPTENNKGIPLCGEIRAKVAAAAP